MSEGSFEPRKPDYKGYSVGEDGKPNFYNPTGAIWKNKDESMTLVREDGTKVRFFPIAEIEKAQREQEEIEQRKKATSGQGATATPIE